MLQCAQTTISNYVVGYINAPKTVRIAPAPQNKYLTLSSRADGKYENKHHSYTGAQAVSIARRNARERNRVKQVNDGFNALRRRLPSAIISALSGGARRGSGKKLSKVDTLRMVVEYIRHLENLIDDSDTTLGYTRTIHNKSSNTSEKNEVIHGDNSPYSESASSPESDFSSSVSSAYSSNYIPNYYEIQEEQVFFKDEEDLLDEISW